MSFNYNKLWTLLESKKLTKDELRRKIGASQTTIVKMGRNENVSLDIIDRICETLNCSPDDFLEYINTNNSNEDTRVFKKGEIYYAYFHTEDNSLSSFVPALIYQSNESLLKSKTVLAIPLVSSITEENLEGIIVLPKLKKAPISPLSEPTSVKFFQKESYLLVNKMKNIRRIDIMPQIGCLSEQVIAIIDKEISLFLGLN